MRWSEYIGQAFEKHKYADLEAASRLFDSYRLTRWLNTHTTVEISAGGGRVAIDGS